MAVLSSAMAALSRSMAALSRRYKEDAYILGHLSSGFRVIECRASLPLARHVQWLHARARLTGGSLRVASPAIGGSARLPPPAELRVVALGAHSPWFAPRFV